MRELHIIRGTALIVFLVNLLAAAAPDANAEVNRFFLRGDGTINMVSAKSGASFEGRYRDEGGTYDEKALRAIHEVFGAEYGNPIASVSLRLIELIDYLQDHFRPGARVSIASGYRSPEYNTALRDKGRLAAKASLHQYGMATDMEIEGVASREVWEYVKEHKLGGAGYYHGGLVHVDVGPARFWDENTSGVGTDISDENKLIGLVTNYDMYLPGEPVTLRFIRMTAFPIRVATDWEIDRVEEDGSLKKACGFKPTFAVPVPGDCPQFADIGEMLGIHCTLPGDLPPGRYRIRATFCQKEWKAMPGEIATPEIEIARPRQ